MGCNDGLQRRERQREREREREVAVAVVVVAVEVVVMVVVVAAVSVCARLTHIRTSIGELQRPQAHLNGWMDG